MCVCVRAVLSPLSLQSPSLLLLGRCVTVFTPAIHLNLFSLLVSLSALRSLDAVFPQSNCESPSQITKKKDVVKTTTLKTKKNMAPTDATGHGTIRHTVASQASAAISTICFFPFDVVRMRFMSQDGTSERGHNGRARYSSTFGSVRTIAREEGVSALFRSCHVAILGVTFSWGVYMSLYRTACASLPQGDTFAQTSVASVFASSVSAFAGSPIWLIKTRMQLEEAKGNAGASLAGKEGVVRHYRTFHGGVRHAIRTDGLRSLWRGVSAQMLLGIPHSFMFPIYDWTKRTLARRGVKTESAPPRDLSLAEVCLCSVSSKTVVSLVGHPLAVLKTRLMDHRSRLGDVQYQGLLQSAATVLRREGFKGVFRGVLPGLVHIIPRSVMQFVLYEAFLKVPSPR